MRDKLTTCLWFERGDAHAAATFYTGLFPDSRIDAIHRAPADNPSSPAGGELMVEFTLLGRPFVALNGHPPFRPNDSVSFMVTTEDQAETDRYWDAIVGGGGAESMCGWCSDRWGFSWQITPRVLMDVMSGPDRAAAQRAMAAMMQMKRIDVAAIERARDGAAA